MGNEDDRTVRERIDKVMDEILPAELKDAPNTATPGEISRRRWFGAGTLIFAAMCMAVAVAPWPSKGLFDFTIWGVYSIVLLLIGAWQIDRASRDEIEAERPTLEPSWDIPTGTDEDRKIRRVK